MARDRGGNRRQGGAEIPRQTITIVWEAGLQALDPLNFSGPKWEELTGIKVKVVELPIAEMFTKIMQEYRAGTGAYDALNVVPAWMPDLANAGALEVARPLCRQIRLSATSCRRSPRPIATTR